MKRLLPILLLLVSSVAYAEEPITGAFGIALGEAVDKYDHLDDSLAKIVNYADAPMFREYNFEPKIPSNIFTVFSVRTTLFKHQIWGIFAAVYVDSCEPEFKALKNILTKKYGQSEEFSDLLQPFEEIVDSRIWDDSKNSLRSVRLVCEEVNDPKAKYLMGIKYLDWGIVGLGKDEVDPETQAKVEAEADNL